MNTIYKKYALLFSLMLTANIHAVGMNNDSAILKTEIKCNPKNVLYGQNIQFDIGYINNSKEQIRIGGLPFSPSSCVLYVSKNDDNEWQLIRRYSTNRNNQKDESIDLQPGQKVIKSFLLYNDLGQVGNLLPGDYKVTIGNHVSVLKIGGKKFPAQLPTKGDLIVDLNVENSLVNQKEIENFLDVNSVVEINPGLNLLGILKTRVASFRKYLKQFPNAPMSILLEMEVSRMEWEIIRKEAAGNGVDQAAVDKIVNRLFELAKGRDVLPLQKINIYKLIFKNYHSGYKDPTPYLRVAKYLFELDSRNSKVNKRIADMKKGVLAWDNEIVSDNYVSYYSKEDMKKVIDSFDLRLELMSEYPDVVDKLKKFKELLLQKIQK